MTVRHRSFWIYLCCVLGTGLGAICGMLGAWYHPTMELRDNFIALDTDTTSISIQWPQGDLAVWISGEGSEWRIWPPSEPRPIHIPAK